MTGAEERMARNEVRFREANERVGNAARRLGVEQPLPFICECGRPDCTAMVRLLPADYERLRSVATHFVYAPGHETDMPNSRLLETVDGAVFVERLDGPGRIAVETDPRATAVDGSRATASNSDAA